MKAKQSKRKSKAELQAEASRWLKSHGWNADDAKAIAAGSDSDCVIDPVTGRVWYRSDLEDLERIKRFKEGTNV